MGAPACTITSLTAHGGNVVMGFPTVMIGGMPASRIGDMHACPMVTGIIPHVGGPFVLGSFTVLVGYMPQSRVGDMLVCVGPPDTAAMGVSTVMVGMSGGGGFGGLMKGLAMAAGAVMGRLFNSPSAYPYTEQNPDGTYTTQYSPIITIKGDMAFTMRAIQALKQLEATRTGKAIEKGISDSGHHVTIQQTNDNNGYCQAKDYNDARKPGTGTDSTVSWNPNHNTVDAAAGDNPGSTVILGHEMTHAYHNATGTNANGPDLSYPGQNGTSALGEERSTVGASGTQVQDPSGNPIAVPDYSKNVPTENSLRDDMGIPRRSTYYPSNWPGGAPW